MLGGNVDVGVRTQFGRGLIDMNLSLPIGYSVGKGVT